MPSSALHPFGVVLELDYHSDRLSDRVHGLTVIRVPIPLICELAPTGPGVIWSSTRRAVISRAPSRTSGNTEHDFAILRTIATWLASQTQEPLSGNGRTLTRARHMSEPPPSASVVARWISLRALDSAQAPSPSSASNLGTPGGNTTRALQEPP